MTVQRVPALALLVLLVTASIATGCGGEDGSAPSQALSAVATTSQIGALAREVAGDRARITVLIRPGTDPHDYELRSDDLKAIKSARLILRNGLGLDDFLDRALKNADRAAITVTDGVRLRFAGQGSGGGAGGTPDPHVWHDPENDKVIVANIARALAEQDPANASFFEQNAARYRSLLDETDVQVRELIDSIPTASRKIVTNHDTLQYFTDRYGLVFVGAVIPSVTTQAEPSAKDLAALTDLIKRERVKAIFAESTIDPKVARELARDTGVRIVTGLLGDSLGAPGSGADTVHGMLLANASMIAEALR